MARKNRATCSEEALRKALPPLNPLSLVGESPAFKRAIERAACMAGQSRPILITGPTGAGKDVFARLIHRESKRQGSFVPVNCAAIPGDLAEAELFGYRKGAFTGAHEDSPGLIGQAVGGTLFLDEVAELSLPVQLKLLRFLQDKTRRRLGTTLDEALDVRIVAATNQPLEALVSCGKMRQDLYFRLRMLRIEVPSLRERGADVLLIARHFLDEDPDLREKRLILSAAAAGVLSTHTWPGNIRELQSALLEASLEAKDGRISARALERTLGIARTPRVLLSGFLALLEDGAWHLSSELAARLGISPRSVTRGLRRLSMQGAIEQEGSRRKRRYRRVLGVKVVDPDSVDIDLRREAQLNEVLGRLESISRRDLVSMLEMSDRTANRLLRRLARAGTLIAKGKGRAVRYFHVPGPLGSTPGPGTDQEGGEQALRP